MKNITQPSFHQNVKPVKRLLTALDSDTTTKLASEKGFSIAATTNANVFLLQVSNDNNYFLSLESPPIMGFSELNIVDYFKYFNPERVTNISEYFLDKVNHQRDDETIRYVKEKDNFAKRILKTAKHLKGNIVVIGSHSRIWLEQLLKQSEPGSFNHHTSIPLFVIPSNENIS